MKKTNIVTSVLAAVVTFAIMFLSGCMAQPGGESNFDLAVLNDDGDNILGMSSEELCKSTKGNKDECIEQAEFALYFGDCDNDKSDDPAGCPATFAGCSESTSLCATCISPAGAGHDAAVEYCDGVDNNCDGVIDEGCDLCANVVCDDDNVCTDDACDPATGECVFTNNTADCDDGSACSMDDTCVDGACVGGDAPDCDDLDACTVDACDPLTGCVNNEASCDDGSACTTDSCDPATGCVNEDVICDDGDACTTDSCDPATGCVSTPIPGCAAPCVDDADCAVYEDPQLPANLLWGCDSTSHCGTCEDDGDGVCGEVELNCSDNYDGDADGFIDCADPNCFLDPACFVPECLEDADCGAGFICEVGICIVEPCVPVCDGLECGSDGCGGSCGNCEEGFICNAGFVCEAVPAPQPEGAGDCSDGVDNDEDGLTDCQEASCDGAVCGVGKTCQAGLCEDVPPVEPDTFVTITIEAPVLTEAWIYGAGIQEKGDTPFSASFTQAQACNVDDGVEETIDGLEVAARVKGGTWGWYGCTEGAPALSTLVVKVEGEIIPLEYVVHPWTCSVEGSLGNIVISKEVMGCP